MVAADPDLPSAASGALESQGVWWRLAAGLPVCCVFLTCQSLSAFEISFPTHGVYISNVRACVTQTVTAEPLDSGGTFLLSQFFFFPMRARNSTNTVEAPGRCLNKLTEI